MIIETKFNVENRVWIEKNFCQVKLKDMELRNICRTDFTPSVVSAKITEIKFFVFEVENGRNRRNGNNNSFRYTLAGEAPDYTYYTRNENEMFLTKEEAEKNYFPLYSKFLLTLIHILNQKIEDNRNNITNSKILLKKIRIFQNNRK